MNIALKHAIHDSCEVLSQYIANTHNADDTLGEMFATQCCKFTKKEIFNYALTYLLEKENITPREDKLESKVSALISLLERRFSDDIIDKIINTIKKAYKLK